MKKTNLLILIFIIFFACREAPTQFSEIALQEKFITLNGETVTFESILKKHKGKIILIDFWATWCRDCISELPRVKELQKEKPEIDYVFLSLDRSIDSWVSGINKFEIKGDHYFMSSGWDGPFVDFIDLDWITRYMVIDSQGNIKIFRSIKVNNKHLRESLTN